MNQREATIHALRAIIDDSTAQLANSADIWCMHADTHEPLTEQDIERVKRAGRSILRALDRRLSRLSGKQRIRSASGVLIEQESTRALGAILAQHRKR